MVVESTRLEADRTLRRLSSCRLMDVVWEQGERAPVGAASLVGTPNYQLPRDIDSQVVYK